jgi:hypothetical protein
MRILRLNEHQLISLLPLYHESSIACNIVHVNSLTRITLLKDFYDERQQCSKYARFANLENTKFHIQEICRNQSKTTQLFERFKRINTVTSDDSWQIDLTIRENLNVSLPDGITVTKSRKSIAGELSEAKAANNIMTNEMFKSNNKFVPDKLWEYRIPTSSVCPPPFNKTSKSKSKPNIRQRINDKSSNFFKPEASCESYIVDPTLSDYETSSTLPSDFEKKVINRNFVDNSRKPIAICFGFLHEEIAKVRALLDSVGASQLRVVPCSDNMIRLPLSFLYLFPEPKWENPLSTSENIRLFSKKPKTRCLILGNASLEAQLTIKGLLEYSGLPPLCLSSVTKSANNKSLGEIIEKALKNYVEHPNTDMYKKMRTENIIDGKNTNNLAEYINHKIKTPKEVLKRKSLVKSNDCVKDRITEISRRLGADQVVQHLDKNRKSTKLIESYLSQSSDIALQKEEIHDQFLFDENLNTAEHIVNFKEKKIKDYSYKDKTLYETYHNINRYLRPNVTDVIYLKICSIKWIHPR